MSNTIIYVFVIIAVILVVGFIYGYFKSKSTASSSNPSAFSSQASQDAYTSLMTAQGGKRKRNKPRKRR